MSMTTAAVEVWTGFAKCGPECPRLPQPSEVLFSPWRHPERVRSLTELHEPYRTGAPLKTSLAPSDYTGLGRIGSWISLVHARAQREPTARSGGNRHRHCRHSRDIEFNDECSP